MSSRVHASLGALAIGLAVVWLAPLSVEGQAGPVGAKADKAWTPPLAPDGHPDLQGVWLSNSATPLERPKALEGRQALTDVEVTELKRRAARLFAEGNNDFAAGDNVFLTALADPAQYRSPGRTTGGSVEMVEREFNNRTSLIVDPPDGKIPALTPEAQQRRAAAARAVRLPPAGPEDLRSDGGCSNFGRP